ncbi:hypothetical protein NN561_012102 [Cricetulus griseus]
MGSPGLGSVLFLPQALLLLLLVLLLRVPPSRGFPGSGDSPLEDDGVWYSHSLYKDTPWCSPIKVKYGDVYCRAPPGGYYKTALGTRCDIRCRKGYELHGSSQLICQSNKRWSDKVICKLRRCGKLNVPENGYMKCSSDGDNYGATCEFSCIGGYELQGSPARVCQSNLAWSGTEPTCAAMNVNVGVRTAAALLDQFYEKRRLLIVSTPTARNLLYRMQLGMLQQAQCGLDLRHVTVVELVGVFPTLIGRIRAKIMPPALALQLRLLLRIPLYSFSMVLVDKHGMDKERYVSLVTPMALFNLIDTFPLRKEEMILQAEMGQTCNT